MRNIEFKPRELRVVVPAGKYVLGDPCYVFPDHGKWMQLLKSCNYFQDSPIGQVDGYSVLGFATRWGDGLYEDQDGFKYPVDAGMIGLVPLGLAQIEPNRHFETRIIEFAAKETLCVRDEEGVLTFGPHVIHTGHEDE
jgi:hypothetical protein